LINGIHFSQISRYLSRKEGLAPMTRTIDASNSAAEVAMGYELADSTPSSTACCNRYDAWALDYITHHFREYLLFHQHRDQVHCCWHEVKKEGRSQSIDHILFSYTKTNLTSNNSKIFNSTSGSVSSGRAAKITGR